MMNWMNIVLTVNFLLLTSLSSGTVFELFATKYVICEVSFLFLFSLPQALAGGAGIISISEPDQN